MERVKIHDKEFELFISAEQIDEGIAKVARSLDAEFRGKRPLLLGVLNGSFLFLADLIKKMDIELEISFVKLASYHGTSSTGNVKHLVGLNERLEGRHVIIVEDIVDTGLTIESLMAQVKEHHPASISIATLLFKPDAYKKDIPIDHIALDVPNDFLVGYGLDYDGLGRNLKHIYTLVEQ